MRCDRRLRSSERPLRISRIVGGSMNFASVGEWNAAQSRSQFQPTIVATRINPSLTVS
jgi:hypothetical protein